MDNKNSFETFFDESFIKDFVTAQASETRESTAFITSYAMMLKSEQQENLTQEFCNELSNGIMKQCCHIMKSSELYAQIFEIIFNPSLSVASMDIKAFFSSFTECVRKSLEGTCTFEAEFGGEVYAALNQKILSYVLLIYFRSMVLEGVKDIKLSYAEDDGDLVIEVKVGKKSDSRKLNYPNDDFFAKYHNKIISIFVNKLGGELHEYKNSMKIIFKKVILDGTKDLLMQEPEMRNSMGVLNLYNIMLSDVSDNLI